MIAYITVPIFLKLTISNLNVLYLVSNVWWWTQWVSPTVVSCTYLLGLVAREGQLQLHVAVALELLQFLRRWTSVRSCLTYVGFYTIYWSNWTTSPSLPRKTYRRNGVMITLQVNSKVNRPGYVSFGKLTSFMCWAWRRSFRKYVICTL